MDQIQQNKILSDVKDWFKSVIVPNHILNTKKLINPTEFNINPFLTPYLAGFFSGSLDPESVAKVLIYPRILGTSITTSFGTNMQSFISDVLKNTVGSLVPGIDIEFTDAVDGRKKYCQVKLGPNTLNKDDVETIHNHFKSTRNLSRTNRVAIQLEDLVVGILYGEPGQESAHYKRLKNEYNYPLYIGEEFWYRLTGNHDFYKMLQKAIAEAAAEAGASELIQNTIRELSQTQTIKDLAGDLS
jgi:hypothetical protein